MGAFDPSSGGQDSVTGGVIAVFTVLGLAALHLGFGGLEQAVASHQHISHMLRSAYRELATMGLIAFMMFAVQTAGLLPQHSLALYEFESIHVMLFILAIVFLLSILTLVGLSLQVAARWDSIETQYAFDLHAYSTMKARFVQVQALLGIRISATTSSINLTNATAAQSAQAKNCTCLPRQAPGQSTGSNRLGTRAFLYFICTKPLVLAEYVSLLTKVRFLEQRYKFLTRNELPGDFLFSAYLRKCKHYAFQKLVQLPISVWKFFSFVITVDLYVRALWPWYSAYCGPIVFVVFVTSTVFALAVAIFFKIRSIHWSILHSAYLPKRSPLVDSKAYQEECIRAQKGLFWFGYPVLILRCMQAVIFGVAFALAVTVRFWYEFQDAKLTIVPFIVLLACIVSTLMLRAVVPLYIISLHTGELVDLRILVEAVEKQRNVEKVRRKKLREKLRDQSSSQLRPRGCWELVGAWLWSDKMREAINLAIYVDFFVITLIVSQWLSQPQLLHLYIVQLALSVAICVVYMSRFVLRMRPFIRASNGTCAWLGEWIELVCVVSSMSVSIVGFALHRYDEVVPTLNAVSRDHDFYANNSRALMFVAVLVLGGLWTSTIGRLLVPNGSPTGVESSIPEMHLAAGDTISAVRADSSDLIQLPKRVSSSFLAGFPRDATWRQMHTGSMLPPAASLPELETDACMVENILDKSTKANAYRSDLVDESGYGVYSQATLTETAARVLANRLASMMVKGQQPQREARQISPNVLIGPLAPASNGGPANFSSVHTLTPAQRAELAQVGNMIGNDICQADGIQTFTGLQPIEEEFDGGSPVGAVDEDETDHHQPIDARLDAILHTLTSEQRAELGRIANHIGADICATDGLSTERVPASSGASESVAFRTVSARAGMIRATESRGGHRAAAFARDMSTGGGAVTWPSHETVHELLTPVADRISPHDVERAAIGMMVGASTPTRPTSSFTSSAGDDDEVSSPGRLGEAASAAALTRLRVNMARSAESDTSDSSDGTSPTVVCTNASDIHVNVVDAALAAASPPKPQTGKAAHEFRTAEGTLPASFVSAGTGPHFKDAEGTDAGELLASSCSSPPSALPSPPADAGGQIRKQSHRHAAVWQIFGDRSHAPDKHIHDTSG